MDARTASDPHSPPASNARTGDDAIPLNQAAESGLRIALWALIAQALIFVVMHYMSRSVTADLRSTTDLYARSRGDRVVHEWMQGIVGAWPAIRTGVGVALALGVVRFGRAMSERATRVLGIAAGAFVATGALVELYQHILTMNLFRSVESYNDDAIRSAQRLWTLGAGLRLIGVGLFLVAIPRASRRVPVGLAVAAGVLVLWHQGVPFYASITESRMGGMFDDTGWWPLVHSITVCLYAGTIGAMCVLATRAAPQLVPAMATATAPAPGEDPYRGAKATAPLTPREWERASDGIALFHTALILRVFLLIGSVFLGLMVSSSQSIEFAKFILYTQPLAGFAIAAMMVVGLYRYAELPRETGARDGAAIALVATLASIGLELNAYARLVSAFSGSYPRLSEIRSLPYLESVSQAVGLVGMLGLLHSASRVARFRGHEHLVSGAGLVSAMLLGTVFGSLILRYAIEVHWVRGPELLMLALVVLVFALIAIVSFMRIVRGVRDSFTSPTFEDDLPRP